ncbi:phosphopantetheine-binding protein, partial [Corallococcus sp. 4LFB]|uniref:phosphopantetheine-binding protein n=1 Tax=Corallococcus sp. 4LFB TaxID=3383249 RepID=UPI00397626B8
MVPSAVVVLPALPLTTNGKVDRKALPAPDLAGSDPREYVAPRTPTEQRLAELWQELLGVKRVGAHDHFFDLGGHSLLATQALSRIRQAFTVELPLRRLFESPTLDAVARLIDEALAGKGNRSRHRASRRSPARGPRPRFRWRTSRVNGRPVPPSSHATPWRPSRPRCASGCWWNGTRRRPSTRATPR